MKTALFARYSSKMQDEMSLDAQVFEMEEFAKKQGWLVVDRYLMPEVRSTDLEKAAEYQRLIDDAKAKKWQVLLCHKLDRLGRDRDMVVMFKAGLRRKGIEIKSVVENLSDSMADRMMEQIHEVFSDYYAKNLGNETRKGHRQLTRQGYWKGGQPAWGLMTEEVDIGAKRPRQRLKACPVRGPLMVIVFEKVAAGETPEKVRRWVANQTSDAEWTPQAFYARIHNPVYYGRLEYGRTTLPAGRPRKKLESSEITVGQWEGLVSQELWESANAVVANGRRKYSRRGRSAQPYLLSGLMRCSECGSSIIGGVIDSHRKYRCSNRKCGSSTVRASVIEEVVLRETQAWMNEMDDAQIIALVRAKLQPVKEDSKAREVELRAQLSEVRLRQRRLLDAIEQGGPVRLYSDRLQELTAEESDLAERIALAQPTGDGMAEALTDNFAEMWLDLKENLAQGPTVDKLQVLLRHAFEVEICIPKEEGQLFLKLTSSPEPVGRGLVYGRSAPNTDRPRRVLVRKFGFPFVHPFQNRRNNPGRLGEVCRDSLLPPL